MLPIYTCQLTHIARVGNNYGVLVSPTMKGMILAAGFGTRLWPLTEERSKPSIPFMNRPLISYSVAYLASFGINEIIINLHHQPESIRQALGDGSAFGVRLHYSYEEEILGTSGAIDRVRDMFCDGDFVVVNGKIVTDIDLTSVMRTHAERDAIATLVLRQNAGRERFSIVEIDADNRIRRFAGFPEPGANSSEPPLMFTGIQVLSPKILDYIPRNCFSHSTVHVYPRAMEDQEAVIAHVAKGEWYEMSTLDRYLGASVAFLRKSEQRFVAGRGSTISDDSVIEDSVLWDDIVVESGCRLRQVVVGDRVRVPKGTDIERAVIVRGDSVRKMERGEIVGENLIVPL